MAVKGLEELKPVYLIYGKEELLLERALHRLRDRVAEVADLDYNFHVFDGESADPDAVVAAANTLPFASERRLVVVRRVDAMKAAAQAVLADYASAPAPSACVVLVAATVAKNSRLYKAVDALGGVAEYSAPKRNEYPAWVIDLFASKGRSIGRDGAEALVRAVGRDLRRLETEADKVIAFAGARTELERSDVERVVIETAPTSIFEFLDAIGGRECATALVVLRELLGGGEALLGVHALTIRHLRALISTRSLLDRGSDRSAMQRELGVADWQLRNLVGQANRFEPAELVEALRSAAEVEARLKSGQGEPQLVFERWIADVCARPGVTGARQQ